MADEPDPRQFPDVKDKLAAPKKLSQFEKDRQYAEAKRIREEEENAAALREFEDSFANDDDDKDDAVSRNMGGRGGRGAPSGHRGQLNGGRQSGGPRSGPGSLPGPGLGMPPSLRRKRELEEAREAEEARRAEGGFDLGERQDFREGRSPAVTQEDDRDDVTPKPTMQLSSIPPGTSVEEIKALLSSLVKVHSVRFIPPAGPSGGRKSLTAIATLDSTTSAVQIDKAVSSLRDHYMGCGFYLSLSRHLSSAAQFQGIGPTGGSSSSEPFGAQRARPINPRHSMRNAPPPRDQRGFAPPESYDQQAPSTRPAGAQVEVHAPLDIATIRAIHTISGKILAEKDANRALEMEALLMTLPEVQKDERFAFLYDSKSPAGVYYRFCLWGPESVDEQKQNARGPERIFSDMDTDWMPPNKETPFLDLTSLAQATDHPDYDESDDEADDDGDERKLNSGPGGEVDPKRAERSRLTPLQRARFTRLLSRLPTSIARLRQGDISRISNYVVNHAGGGAEEFVDLLLLNIEKPFSTTLAAKFEDYDDYHQSHSDNRNGQSGPENEDQEGEGEEDDYEPADSLPALSASNQPAMTPPTTTTSEQPDPSNPKLIALYTISDILSASSTAGARNAWKYRTLFEAGLVRQKTFRRLGRLDRELGWGRLKAEQWKRKVGVVLGVWESWSVFSAEVMGVLKRDFFEGGEDGEQQQRGVEEGGSGPAKKEEKRDAGASAQPGWMSRFRKVEAKPVTPGSDSAPASALSGTEQPAPNRLDEPSPAQFDKPMGVLDGPQESAGNSKPETSTTSQQHKPPGMLSGFKMNVPKGPVVPKRRMRAEDMFGDSDDE